MNITLICYAICLAIGIVGSILTNKAKTIPRIGQYLLFCTGHYIFHYENESFNYEDYKKIHNTYSNMPMIGAGFQCGGKHIYQLSVLWWLKEILFVFPVLGLINILLTLYATISGVFFAYFYSPSVFGISLGHKKYIWQEDRMHIHMGRTYYTFSKAWVL